MYKKGAQNIQRNVYISNIYIYTLYVQIYIICIYYIYTRTYIYQRKKKVQKYVTREKLEKKKTNSVHRTTGCTSHNNRIYVSTFAIRVRTETLGEKKKLEGT